jgi:hypothetical protein
MRFPRSPMTDCHTARQNVTPQLAATWSAGDLARENTAAGSLPLRGDCDAGGHSSV